MAKRAGVFRIQGVWVVVANPNGGHWKRPGYHMLTDFLGGIVTFFFLLLRPLPVSAVRCKHGRNGQPHIQDFAKRRSRLTGA